MKVVLFGLGSIGQRHARLLKSNFEHELYAFRSNMGQLPVDFEINEIKSWKEFTSLNPEVVFITNPTSLHIETALKCAELGCRLFIEKPLSHELAKVDELISIVKRKGLPTYVAYNLRFHPVIKALKRYVDSYQFLHMRVISSSYLPDWRVGQDHRKTYSSHSEMGGGVLLDLSHEVDYTYFLLGKIENILGRFARRSSVTIDSEDYADLLVETSSGPANIHINSLSRLKERYVKIDFHELSIIGDLINASIKEISDDGGVSINEYEVSDDYTYIEQMKYFFDNIENPAMMNNVIEAKDVLTAILRFKENR